MRIFILLLAVLCTPPSLALRAQSTNLASGANPIAQQTSLQHFYDLTILAKQEFCDGHPKEAGALSVELLQLAEMHKTNWNYGNAIHDGNMILGRIAVLEQQLDEAKAFLEKAGKTPGSPQLDAFGPSMCLAKDLLEHNETSSVLKYLEDCHKFWPLGQDRLDDWTRLIKDNKIPSFGANLTYYRVSAK